MIDLDVGRDGIVWGCTQSNVPVVRTGVTVDEISGTAWQVENSYQCKNVAVCTSGNVWTVTPSNTLQFRTGIIAVSLELDLIGDGFEDQNPTSMTVKEVACGGEAQVWLTD